MTISQRIAWRFLSFFEKTIHCAKRGLLAHEADRGGFMRVATAPSSAAIRALEYDAYMRNNRSANTLLE